MSMEIVTKYGIITMPYKPYYDGDPGEPWWITADKLKKAVEGEYEKRYPNEIL